MAIRQIVVGMLKRAGVDRESWAYASYRKVSRRLQNRRIKTRIRGRDNVVVRKGAILQGVSFEIEGDNNTVTIAPGAFVSKVRFRIWGNGHRVEISEGCRFAAGVIWMQNARTSIRIGSNTTIEFAEFALVEDEMSIEIGEDCMIAYAVDFRTSDSHSVVDLGTGKRVNPPAPIVIGDHVWIARGAQIGKGVHIGGNSIVAAQSVVTKDIGPNVVAGGTPARVLKENCSWHRNLLGPDETVSIKATASSPQE